MADSVFDGPLIHEDCMDDSDEGFVQGDWGTIEDDASLRPILRMQKYARSTNLLDRQRAIRIVQELLRTVAVDTLRKDLHDIMKELTRVGDESILKADLLDQIPHIAAQTIECSSKLGDLRNTVCDYLIPLVVRNLGCVDAAVDKAAHAALIQLIEQGFITKQQVEIQVCPSILALSKVDNITDLNATAGAIILMCKLAQHLGRDVMERVFLKRFTELCSSQMFYIRKMCAANFGEFCNVVGPKAFEDILLPCYIVLCGDFVWGVRKACAEVAMYVSCACSPKSRKDILAPVFVKLLQDECRWVRMAAYQSLGPLIATFADPVLIAMAYNKNGDLVLVNKEGEEFRMNDSHSMPLTDTFMINSVKNIELAVESVMNGVPFGSNDTELSEEPKDDFDCLMKFQEIQDIKKNLSDVELGDDLKEDNCFNGFKKLQNIGDTEENLNKAVNERLEAIVYCDPIQDVLDNQDNVNVINQQPQCDILTEKLNNEISKELSSLNIADNIDSGNSERNTESLSINSIKDVNDNDKVNNVDLEDDLSLFHSHVYWYISPDLPLDPSIIAGLEIPNKDDPPGYETQSTEDLNSIEAVVDQDSTISLEDASDVEMNKTQEITTPLIHTLPEQDVIPQPLIEHFVSMTDRNFCMNIDSEITYHCAYSLPAVALTLGKDNWYLLKDTVECLAGDMQYKIRKTVACGLHELAIILGPKIATESLTPLFDGFIKDLDEVRIGILKHLADFLKLIEAEKRVSYLPKLTQFLKTDNEWNWRFRYELAQQLLYAVSLFKPSDTAKYLGVIAIDLLCDKVAAVREMAVLLVVKILSYIASEPGLTPNLLIKLAEHFAHSKKWKRRQTFCLLCCELLKQNTLAEEQFATDVMPHLLDLSWDPVTNVRLVVARCLSNYLITNDYFRDPANGLYDGLETVLRRLQSDKDCDVRQSAEPE